jgi:hypothetical protein
MVPNQFQRLDKVHSFPTNIYLLNLVNYNSGNLKSKTRSDLDFIIPTLYFFFSYRLKMGCTLESYQAGPTRLAMGEKHKTNRYERGLPRTGTGLTGGSRGMARRRGSVWGKQGSRKMKQKECSSSPRPPRTSRNSGKAWTRRDQQVAVVELGGQRRRRRARARKNSSEILCLGGSGRGVEAPGSSRGHCCRV